MEYARIYLLVVTILQELASVFPVELENGM